MPLSSLLQFKALCFYLTLVAIASCSQSEETATAAEDEPPMVQYSFLCPPGFDSEDEVTAQVNFPAGGEQFQIGDTIGIALCSEDTTSGDEESAEIFLIMDGSSQRIVAIDHLSNEEFNLLLTGRLNWVIPTTVSGFNDQGQPAEVPIQCARCQIKFNIYSAQAGQNFGLSGDFSIAAE